MSRELSVFEKLKTLNDLAIDVDRRIIYLFGELSDDDHVDGAAVGMLIQSLNNINLDPIILVINSPGGSDDITFSLYDMIVNSPSEVITIGTGFVCSAAALIIACGDRRYATENCWFMAHKGKAELVGDEDELVAQAEASTKCSDRYWKLLGRHTKRSGTEWYNKSKKRGEVWLDAEGMLKYGVIDGIIKPDRRILDPLPRKKIKRIIEEEDED